MAGRDLRFIFGSNDRSVLAQEAFTNRQAQWEALGAALAEHTLRVRTAGFRVEDLEAPRRNVMVFHGIGGIGKTTLSRKLEASLAYAESRPGHWPALSHPHVRRVLPVRIDLAHSTRTDFEHVVLTMRLVLAGLGRPMPAFDLALRRYWEHNHPSEPIEEYLRRRGLLSRFSAAAALPDQIASALSDVAQALLLPGTVGSVVGQGIRLLVTALREHRQALRALSGCERLADLLESEPDLDMLSYLPHLLAWDISQLPADQEVLPVMLLDTFEHVGDRTHRDFERLLQRMVWLMPNAFFVITGRNRLQWADRGLTGQLDWAGPAAWPDLASPADPGRVAGARTGQILVGDFSPEDCQDYLAQRLTRDGEPLIAAPLRRAIAERSHGFPLYLDLSVMRFLELRREGVVPEPADFQYDFPALIAHTLRDLTAQERHVLRSVSLLGSFSVSLATRVAGLERDAAALRLVERPFIKDSGVGPWRYHLHDVIRAAIQQADDGSDDHWSAHDWRRTAQRALQAVGDEWRGHVEHGRTFLIACLQQGLTLARDFRLDLDWLVEAAFDYVDDAIWEPLTLPTPLTGDSEPGLHTAADALVETLSAIARRQRQHRRHTLDRLTAVLASGQLPDDVDELARYYLAKAQRDLDEADASRDGMRQVLAAGGRLAASAGRGLAHLSRREGDFVEALDIAGRLGWEGRHQRVIGDVWWVHGDMERATRAYCAEREEAEQHHAIGEVALAQASIAFTTAFLDRERGDDEIDLAEQLLARASLRASGITVRIAALIRDAGRADDLDDRAELVLADIAASGLAYTAARLELALCFHHVLLGDADRVAASIARVRDLTADGGYASFVEVAHFMADLPLPPELRRARWVDGETATRARWRALVAVRQAQLR